MQRLEAKNPPERPLLSAETGNVQIGDKNPRTNGLFSIDDGFCGSGRLDGGVRSHIRTGLEPELPDKWLFTGYFPVFGPVIEKCTRIERIFSMA